jgi:hypothetical protein
MALETFYCSLVGTYLLRVRLSLIGRSKEGNLKPMYLSCFLKWRQVITKYKET